MAGVVIPVAKALYLCEEVDTESGLTNLYACSNSSERRVSRMFGASLLSSPNSQAGWAR
jgi:hypothetical protein